MSSQDGSPTSPASTVFHFAELLEQLLNFLMLLVASSDNFNLIMKNSLIILSAALFGLSPAYSDYKEVIPHSGLDISSNYTTSLTIGRQKYIDIGNIADCLNLIEISGPVPSFCEIVPGAIHNDTYL